MVTGYKSPNGMYDACHAEGRLVPSTRHVLLCVCILPSQKSPYRGPAVLSFSHFAGCAWAWREANVSVMGWCSDGSTRAPASVAGSNCVCVMC